MSIKGSPIKRLQLTRKEYDYGLQTTYYITQNQKLNKLILAKNIEIQRLTEQNLLLKQNCQSQMTKFKRIITELEHKNVEFQKLRSMELQAIKIRHQKTNMESQQLNNYHAHQIQFLLKEIAQLRSINDSKDHRVELKDHQMKTLKESFERQASQLINEINILRSGLLKLEEQKNRQIKDISNKRSLQKSRTTGIITSRNQNTQFMDKQFRKLNQDLLEKSIKIQNMSRQILKEKKKNDQLSKHLNQQIQSLISKYQQQSKQKQQHFQKIQKSLKQEIIQYKQKQFQYQKLIDTLKNQLEFTKKQYNQVKSIIQKKSIQIKQIKGIIQQERQQHAKQLAIVMSKRKSSKLNSSRSITSSFKDSNIMSGSNQHIQSPNINKKQMRLPSVKQESPDRKQISKQFNQSQFTENQQENQIIRTINHYQLVIQQLKKSHGGQVQLLKVKLKKIQRMLQQKQQQILDILNRFSPLVKIHAEEKTIEQDRKQRIDRHWKSDLALLQILLKKNKIQVFD